MSRPKPEPRMSEGEADAITCALQTAAAAGQRHTDPADILATEVATDLLLAFYAAARRDRATALTVMDHVMELMAPETPALAPFRTESRQMCEEWAAWADQALVLQMLQACIARVGNRAPVNPRKTAMVALWNSLGPDDRAAFARQIGTTPATGR